jgi:hypothetical protein
MKSPLVALALLTLLAGCATAPTAADLAGYYSCRPFGIEATNTDGTPLPPAANPTEIYLLFLQADGRFAAASQRFQFGQMIGAGTAAGQPMQRSSKGTWTLGGGKLLLKSTVDNLGEAEVRIDLKSDGWHIFWNQIEYVQQLADDPRGYPGSVVGEDPPMGRTPAPTSTAGHR